LLGNFKEVKEYICINKTFARGKLERKQQTWGYHLAMRGRHGLARSLHLLRLYLKEKLTVHLYSTQSSQNRLAENFLLITRVVPAAII
jgi:hypothetical protein